jgi:hypothetical protein
VNSVDAIGVVAARIAINAAVLVVIIPGVFMSVIEFELTINNLS